MTLTDRLAQFFQQRPYQWVDGRQLSEIAGYAAWRTRVADCRRKPHSMTIENRVRRLSPSSRVKVSEYRFIPASDERAERLF